MYRFGAVMSIGFSLVCMSVVKKTQLIRMIDFYDNYRAIA